MARLRIGRFTSIAPDVIIALGNHRTDTISTYPFLTLKAFWPTAPENVQDHISKGDVYIGSDVWIGSGSFIGSGVTIGDGSVIGAKSVITKDVPPYSVTVGNPGKVVRYRFSEEIISHLLKIKWWMWPNQLIDRYLPIMFSGNVEEFIYVAKEIIFP
jgi:acetyltransferase-like isoleucine patch superfamily enzyme